jgi:PKD repeat protein
VANDASGYKTIGASFEFGGISNTENSNTELMEKYADFFGLLGPETVYADFYALPAIVEPGETVHFSSTCTGPVTTWEWDFNNDGEVDSYDEHPNHIYTAAGNYDVCLNVWGPEGQHAVMIKDGYIQVNNPAVSFDPVWDTPFNPMNIYITGATLNGTDLQAGAQIGIFDIDPNTGNEICVGAATLTGVITQTNFLEIIASMNDNSNPDEANGFTPGNSFIFKYVDNENQVIEPVNFVFPFQGYDETFAAQGSAIIDLSASILPLNQQIIPISSGWTAVSSYLLPENSNMEEIIAELTPGVEIIQDLTGFYQPGNDASSLTTWNYKSGYLIKSNQAASLTFFGFEPSNKSVPLQEGWNLISVLTDEPVAITQLLGENIGKLEIIKEPAGLGIYWPDMEISDFKNLEPGKAYLVKVSSGFTITY